MRLAESWMLKTMDTREKGSDLTQSYDKIPYTDRKNPNPVVVRQRFRSVKESGTQPSQETD